MTRTRNVGEYCEIVVKVGPDEYKRKAKTVQEAKPFFDRAKKVGVHVIVMRYWQIGGEWREEIALPIGTGSGSRSKK